MFPPIHIIILLSFVLHSTSGASNPWSPPMSVSTFSLLTNLSSPSETDPITFTTSESFLSLPKWESTTNGSIAVKIRTNEPNGVVVYSHGVRHEVTSEDAVGGHDFFAIELLGGHVFLLLNMGSGSIKVKATTRRVDNGLWHSVKVTRDGRSGRIFVDDYSVGFISPGTSTDLDLEGSLFLGSVGTTGFLSTPSTSLSPPPELWSGSLGYGFVGCVKDVVINDDYSFNLTSYVADQDTGGVKVGCNSSIGSHCSPTPTPTAGLQPKCLNDGICLEGWNRFSCSCQATGYHGPNCGRDSLIVSFNGDGQLWKTNLNRPSMTQAEDIYIRFRTMRSSGLLFVATSGPTGSGTYIILSLESSRLRVTLNLGEGNKVTHVGYNLNDDLWHSVKIERRGPSLEVKLDGVTSVTELTGQLITLQVSSIFLASVGVVTDSDLKTSLYQTIKDVPNFAGLIQSVIFNGVDLIESSRSGHFDGNFKSTADVDSSSERDRLDLVTTHSVTFKSRKTFVALHQLKAYSRMFVSFTFKTLSANGLILYNAGRRNHFVSVELDNGHIAYAFNMGDGGGRRLTSRSPKPLNDGHWHSVTVIRSVHNHHSLRVDDQVVTMTSPGINTHLHLSGPLFIGGAENYATLPKLVKSVFGFEGCLSNLDLNNELVDLTNPGQVLTTSSLVSAGCQPFMSLEEKRCFLYSCSTKGVCVGYSPTSNGCDCDESTFTGSSCSEDGVSFRFAGDDALITVTFPATHLDTKSDSVSFGLVTTQTEAILLRVDSSTSSDFMELHILDGLVGVVYNLGYEDHDMIYPHVNVSDGRYHVVRFDRIGQNASLQVDNHNPIHKNPIGKQLTIFNSLSKIQVGGKVSTLDQRIEISSNIESSGPKIRRASGHFRGIMSGLSFDGMKILDLAAENDDRISMDGSVHLLTSMPKMFNPKNLLPILNGSSETPSILDGHRQKTPHHHHHRHHPSSSLGGHHKRPSQSMMDDGESDELILSASVESGTRYCFDDDDCNQLITSFHPTSTHPTEEDLITPFITDKSSTSSSSRTKIVSCDDDDDDPDCREPNETGSGQRKADDDDDDDDEDDKDEDDDDKERMKHVVIKEWNHHRPTESTTPPFVEFYPWNPPTYHHQRTSTMKPDGPEPEQSYRPKVPHPFQRPTSRPVFDFPKSNPKTTFGHASKGTTSGSGKSHTHVTKSSLTSVDRTALLMGIIATIIIVIVSVASVILFARLRLTQPSSPGLQSLYISTGGQTSAVTQPVTSKTYQLVPATTPTTTNHHVINPVDGTIMSTTTHIVSPYQQQQPQQYQQHPAVMVGATMAPLPASILKRKKDGTEWFV